MKEAGNALLEELIGTDAGAIAKEIDKRVEYVLRTQNPKNAGSTEYQKLGEYVLIRMFYKLPADFCEIIGEQFALGSENDSYEFKPAEPYREEFGRYEKTLKEQCGVHGITVVPVIYSEVSKKRYSFPCRLRGIVSKNVAKRDFGLYGECMKLVRRPDSENATVGGVKSAAADAAKNADSAAQPAKMETLPAKVLQEMRLLLCDAEHEERKDLIQRPMIEGERGALDEMDRLMKWQTFLITPFLAVAFFAAAYFSWEFQATGESGIGQTVFLAGMGIGLAVFTIYNTVIRVRKIRRANALVRENNERNRAEYERAIAAEKERYEEEKTQILQKYVL